jgi:peptidoglycan/xylan/chitin deacetylase (PgdA/CDA1 family)
MNVRTLMYHDVISARGGRDSGFSGAGAEHYKLDSASFREHLDALVHGDSAEVPLLTFDDGGASAYHEIAPLLEARGLRGHFFIATDWLGKPGFLVPEQVVELAARGHVIGSHSASHPARIDRLPEAQLRDEWRRSTAFLSELLNAPVELGSIPGGHYSTAVVRAARSAGIRYLFTSEPRSRAWTIDDCTVFGRYAVKRHTSARVAQGYASGAVRYVLPQWAFWQLTKLGKKLAGRSYESARRTLLAAEQTLRPKSAGAPR